MANITVPNIKYATIGFREIAIWKLTRAMKAAGWRYKASSDSAAKDTSGNPSNDKWGPGVQVTGRTATGTFNITAPTTTADMGLCTISGGTITGFGSSGGLSLTGSVGRFLKITGATNSANNGTWQIFRVNSATSIDVINPAAVAEDTPGTAVWSEVDALLDSHPSAFAYDSGPGAWWCAQGPSTLKIPIGNTVPTGFFLIGEEVTQATTGATGEVLGVMLDTSTSIGYMVVNPRASGTGAGVRGWNASSTVTGGVSGATIAPTGTVLEFIMEVVFWKNQASYGHLYVQCIDLANEGTTLTSTNGRFSLMASSLSQCNATICPGGSTGGNCTTNGFPTTGTMAILGYGGSGAAATSSTPWIGLTWDMGSTYMGYGAHVLVANCLNGPGLSADGTFSFIEPYSNIGVYNNTNYFNYVHGGFMYGRLTSTEDGDLWPFAVMQILNNGYTAYTSANRVSAIANNNANTSAIFDTFGIDGYANSGYVFLRGWRRRGFSSGDAFQAFQGAILGFWNSTSISAIYASADLITSSPTPQVATEPVWVVSTQLNQRMRKGTFKWLRLVSNLSPSTVLAGNTFVPVSQPSACPTYMGPWDGVTPFGLPV